MKSKKDVRKKLKEKYDYIYDDSSASVILNWKPREEFWISKYMARAETDRTVVLDKVSISVNGIIVGLADRIIIDKESLEKAQKESRNIRGRK